LVSAHDRNLIEISQDALACVGRDGKITDVNRATVEVTGCSRKEIIGMEFSSFFTEPEKARAGCRKAFAQGSVRDYELAISHRDGHVMPVLCNASVYKGEAGEVVGVFVSARDITEIKRLVEALRSEGTYNRSLIEASLDPLVTIGTHGRITDVNRATEEVTGCSREELVGADFPGYFTDPDAARAGYRKAFGDGLVRGYGLEIRHQDGHTTPVRFNASVYRNEAGEVTGVFAAARAITKRERAETLRAEPALRFLRASEVILDQISDAIFVFARTGEMVMVNETACRILGYHRDDILGRSAGVVFSQLENPPLVEGLDLRHAMSRFAVPAFDTALRTASGHSIAVSFGTSFLRDETGNVIGILGIARDIRERKELEEHLRRYSERLEEDVRSRTVEIEASEQKYRMLVDQIASAVVRTDSEGRMSSFNRAARRMFGWDDGLIGKSLSDLWCCQDCEAEESCHQAVKSRGEWVGECTMPLANGATAVMFHSCSVLVDSSERPAGVAHVVSDLSDPTGFQRELLRDTRGLLLCDQEGQRQIITCSDKMKRVLDMIGMTADSSETVLIEGESGTGKDLVAQALHVNSSRAGHPYVVVNCATLQEHFLESELLGHERGAFTGAVASKQGLLEVADGGTLFIDEVTEMTSRVQAMALRILETGRFRRMGATEERSVDVRVIVATNKNLEQEVAADRFRDDLGILTTGQEPDGLP